MAPTSRGGGSEMKSNNYFQECANCTRKYEKWCSYFEARQTCDYRQYLQQHREPFSEDLKVSLEEIARQDAVIAENDEIISQVRKELNRLKKRASYRSWDPIYITPIEMERLLEMLG